LDAKAFAIFYVPAVPMPQRDGGRWQQYTGAAQVPAQLRRFEL